MYTHYTTHVTLLQRVSGGNDVAAWQEFCQRYGPLIRGFAARQGMQPADCDEIVQETLLALSKSLPGFEYDPARGKFRSYLKTVVLHQIFRRTRQKRGEVSLGSLDEEISKADGDPEIEQRWEAEWRQYHIRQAMRVIEAEFSDKDRAAFEAYALAGGDASEVAATLDLSANQVYQAKSRIVKRLGELIKQQIDEEG